VDERVGNEELVLGSGPNTSHYTLTAERDIKILS